MKRRDFLTSLAALPWLSHCHRAESQHAIPGQLLGPNFSLGHRLRHQDFPAPTTTRNLDALVIGGGVAGLSAGWKFLRHGFKDFALLELEDKPGGNARSGQNAVSAYPWGAHYLPIPTHESKAVRELLFDLGVIEGNPYQDKPHYADRYLCQAPQERLYLNGIWQEGLLPRQGTSRTDQQQFTRFESIIAHYRQYRDRHGRKAFTIPMAYSSTDPDLLALDKLSIYQYLTNNRFDSPYLHWYVNYACRDDFGTDYHHVSAWAALHYYACRDAQATNADTNSVLTWPEGNGWLTQHMAELVKPQTQTNAIVFDIATEKQHLEVDVYLAEEQRSVRYRTRYAIWAAPLFILTKTWRAIPQSYIDTIARFDYAPWLVANLTVTQIPITRFGATQAWDNVMYDSDSLGYVVATHQTIRLQPGKSVLTYYLPFSQTPAVQARQTLMDTPRSEWIQHILTDLSRPHPELPELIEQMDIYRWGHAMRRPLTGQLFGAGREDLIRTHSRLKLAHADLSGFSVFEEANYHGVRAAEEILTALHHPHESSLRY